MALQSRSVVPYGLLRHQGAMFKAIGRILWRSVRPLRPLTAPDAIAPIERTIAAPPAGLVEQYVQWCGAGQSYRGELPPHMVSQWSLPLVSELLLQMPYRLTSVINQGVTLQVHGPLPRGVPLLVRAAVDKVEQASGRVKVVVAITTGTAQQPLLVSAKLHMSFLLPGKRDAKIEQERPAEPAWQTAGQWQADARDGLRFALLTGDFNPIHWCGPLARRSVFKGTVLHGFGSLVRSFEALPPGSCKEIDVRFLRPVALPSAALQVQTAAPDAEGLGAIRLTGMDGTVHLAGRYR